MEAEVAEYFDVVRTFGILTRVPQRPSGLCCAHVDAFGSPECCSLIAEGADLTFTIREVALLVAAGVETTWFAAHDGLWVLDREMVDPATIRSWLHTGWLAQTLESASHPTRPVIVGRDVVAVAVINGCNADIGLDWYRMVRDLLRDAWQRALDLVGPKPYYVTWGLKPDWTVL